MANDNTLSKDNKTYNTLSKINKTIRFWGLSPIQFTVIALIGAIIVLFLVFAQQNIIIVGIVVAMMFFGFTLFFRSVREETKKGNPDYLKGVTIKQATPTKIVDKQRLFKNLIREYGSNNTNHK